MLLSLLTVLILTNVFFTVHTAEFKKHVQNCVYPFDVETPIYNIESWTKQLHLQQCAFVEVGDKHYAIFVETRPRRYDNEKEIREYFLGLCDDDTVSKWSLCPPNLLKKRSRDCTFHNNNMYGARVHRRFCDVSLISQEGAQCDCNSDLSDSKLFKVTGFPTCFKAPLPDSLCGDNNVCGLASCKPEIINRKIYSAKCDKKCLHGQPFCERPDRSSSQPRVVKSFWTDWSNPYCTDSSCVSQFDEATCINRETGRGDIDCLGPGTSCCTPDIQNCRCHVYEEDGTSKVFRTFSMPQPEIVEYMSEEDFINSIPLRYLNNEEFHKYEHQNVIIKPTRSISGARHDLTRKTSKPNYPDEMVDRENKNQLIVPSEFNFEEINHVTELFKLSSLYHDDPYNEKVISTNSKEEDPMKVRIVRSPTFGEALKKTIYSIYEKRPVKFGNRHRLHRHPLKNLKSIILRSFKNSSHPAKTKRVIKDVHRCQRNTDTKVPNIQKEHNIVKTTNGPNLFKLISRRDASFKENSSKSGSGMTENLENAGNFDEEKNMKTFHSIIKRTSIKDKREFRKLQNKDELTTEKKQYDYFNEHVSKEIPKLRTTLTPETVLRFYNPNDYNFDSNLKKRQVSEVVNREGIIIKTNFQTNSKKAHNSKRDVPFIYNNNDIITTEYSSLQTIDKSKMKGSKTKSKTSLISQNSSIDNLKTLEIKFDNIDDKYAEQETKYDEKGKTRVMPNFIIDAADSKIYPNPNLSKELHLGLEVSTEKSNVKASNQNSILRWINNKITDEQKKRAIKMLNLKPYTENPSNEISDQVISIYDFRPSEEEESSRTWPEENQGKNRVRNLFEVLNSKSARRVADTEKNILNIHIQTEKPTVTKLKLKRNADRLRVKQLYNCISRENMDMLMNPAVQHHYLRRNTEFLNIGEKQEPKNIKAISKYKSDDINVNSRNIKDLYPIQYIDLSEELYTRASPKSQNKNEASASTLSKFGNEKIEQNSYLNKRGRKNIMKFLTQPKKLCDLGKSSNHVDKMTINEENCHENSENQRQKLQKLHEAKIKLLNRQTPGVNSAPNIEGQGNNFLNTNSHLKREIETEEIQEGNSHKNTIIGGEIKSNDDKKMKEEYHELRNNEYPHLYRENKNTNVINFSERTLASLNHRSLRYNENIPEKNLGTCGQSKLCQNFPECEKAVNKRETPSKLNLGNDKKKKFENISGKQNYKRGRLQILRKSSKNKKSRCNQGPILEYSKKLRHQKQQRDIHNKDKGQVNKQKISNSGPNLGKNKDSNFEDVHNKNNFIKENDNLKILQDYEDLSLVFLTNNYSILSGIIDQTTSQQSVTETQNSSMNTKYNRVTDLNNDKLLESKKYTANINATTYTVSNEKLVTNKNNIKNYKQNSTNSPVPIISTSTQINQFIAKDAGEISDVDYEENKTIEHTTTKVNLSVRQNKNENVKIKQKYKKSKTIERDKDNFGKMKKNNVSFDETSNIIKGKLHENIQNNSRDNFINEEDILVAAFDRLVTDNSGIKTITLTSEKHKPNNFISKVNKNNTSKKKSIIKSSNSRDHFKRSRNKNEEEILNQNAEYKKFGDFPNEVTFQAANAEVEDILRSGKGQKTTENKKFTSATKAATTRINVNYQKLRISKSTSTNIDSTVSSIGDGYILPQENKITKICSTTNVHNFQQNKDIGNNNHHKRIIPSTTFGNGRFKNPYNIRIRKNKPRFILHKEEKSKMEDVNQQKNIIEKESVGPLGCEEAHEKIEIGKITSYTFKKKKYKNKNDRIIERVKSENSNRQYIPIKMYPKEGEKNYNKKYNEMLSKTEGIRELNSMCRNHTKFVKREGDLDLLKKISKKKHISNKNFRNYMTRLHMLDENKSPDNNGNQINMTRIGTNVDDEVEELKNDLEDFENTFFLQNNMASTSSQPLNLEEQTEHIKNVSTQQINSVNNMLDLKTKSVNVENLISKGDFNNVKDNDLNVHTLDINRNLNDEDLFTKNWEKEIRDGDHHRNKLDLYNFNPNSEGSIYKNHLINSNLNKIFVKKIENQEQVDTSNTQSQVNLLNTTMERTDSNINNLNTVSRIDSTLNNSGNVNSFINLPTPIMLESVQENDPQLFLPVETITGQFIPIGGTLPSTNNDTIPNLNYGSGYTFTRSFVHGDNGDEFSQPATTSNLKEIAAINKPEHLAPDVPPISDNKGMMSNRVNGYVLLSGVSKSNPVAGGTELKVSGGGSNGESSNDQKISNKPNKNFSVDLNSSVNGSSSANITNDNNNGNCNVKTTKNFRGNGESTTQNQTTCLLYETKSPLNTNYSQDKSRILYNQVNNNSNQNIIAPSSSCNLSLNQTSKNNLTSTTQKYISSQTLNNTSAVSATEQLNTTEKIQDNPISQNTTSPEFKSDSICIPPTCPFICIPEVGSPELSKCTYICKPDPKCSTCQELSKCRYMCQPEPECSQPKFPELQKCSYKCTPETICPDTSSHMPDNICKLCKILEESIKNSKFCELCKLQNKCAHVHIFKPNSHKYNSSEIIPPKCNSYETAKCKIYVTPPPKCNTFTLRPNKQIELKHRCSMCKHGKFKQLHHGIETRENTNYSDYESKLKTTEALSRLISRINKNYKNKYKLKTDGGSEYSHTSEDAGLSNKYNNFDFKSNANNEMRPEDNIEDHSSNHSWNNKQRNNLENKIAKLRKILESEDQNNRKLKIAENLINKLLQGDDTIKTKYEATGKSEDLLKYDSKPKCLQHSVPDHLRDVNSNSYNLSSEKNILEYLERKIDEKIKSESKENFNAKLLNFILDKAGNMNDDQKLHDKSRNAVFTIYSDQHTNDIAYNNDNKNMSNSILNNGLSKSLTINHDEFMNTNESLSPNFIDQHEKYNKFINDLIHKKPKRTSKNVIYKDNNGFNKIAHNYETGNASKIKYKFDEKYNTFSGPQRYKINSGPKGTKDVSQTPNYDLLKSAWEMDKDNTVKHKDSFILKNKEIENIKEYNKKADNNNQESNTKSLRRQNVFSINDKLANVDDLNNAYKHQHLLNFTGLINSNNLDQKNGWDHTKVFVSGDTLLSHQKPLHYVLVDTSDNLGEISNKNKYSAINLKHDISPTEELNTNEEKYVTKNSSENRILYKKPTFSDTETLIMKPDSSTRSYKIREDYSKSDLILDTDRNRNQKQSKPELCDDIINLKLADVYIKHAPKNSRNQLFLNKEISNQAKILETSNGPSHSIYYLVKAQAIPEENERSVDFYSKMVYSRSDVINKSALHNSTDKIQVNSNLSINPASRMIVENKPKLNRADLNNSVDETKDYSPTTDKSLNDYITLEKYVHQMQTGKHDHGATTKYSVDGNLKDVENTNSKILNDLLSNSSTDKLENLRRFETFPEELKKYTTILVVNTRTEKNNLKMARSHIPNDLQYNTNLKMIPMKSDAKMSENNLQHYGYSITISEPNELQSLKIDEDVPKVVLITPRSKRRKNRKSYSENTVSTNSVIQNLVKSKDFQNSILQNNNRQMPTSTTQNTPKLDLLSVLQSSNFELEKLGENGKMQPNLLINYQNISNDLNGQEYRINYTDYLSNKPRMLRSKSYKRNSITNNSLLKIESNYKIKRFTPRKTKLNSQIFTIQKRVPSMTEQKADIRAVEEKHARRISDQQDISSTRLENNSKRVIEVRLSPNYPEILSKINFDKGETMTSNSENNQKTLSTIASDRPSNKNNQSPSKGFNHEIRAAGLNSIVPLEKYSTTANYLYNSEILNSESHSPPLDSLIIDDNSLAPISEMFTNDMIYPNDSYAKDGPPDNYMYIKGIDQSPAMYPTVTGERANIQNQMSLNSEFNNPESQESVEVYPILNENELANSETADVENQRFLKSTEQSTNIYDQATYSTELGPTGITIINQQSSAYFTMNTDTSQEDQQEKVKSIYPIAEIEYNTLGMDETQHSVNTNQNAIDDDHELSGLCFADHSDSLNFTTSGDHVTTTSQNDTIQDSKGQFQNQTLESHSKHVIEELPKSQENPLKIEDKIVQEEQQDCVYNEEIPDISEDDQATYAIKEWIKKEKNIKDSTTIEKIQKSENFDLNNKSSTQNITCTTLAQNMNEHDQKQNMHPLIETENCDTIEDHQKDEIEEKQGSRKPHIYLMEAKNKGKVKSFKLESQHDSTNGSVCEKTLPNQNFNKIDDDSQERSKENQNKSEETIKFEENSSKHNRLNNNVHESSNDEKNTKEVNNDYSEEYPEENCMSEDEIHDKPDHTSENIKTPEQHFNVNLIPELQIHTDNKGESTTEFELLISIKKEPNLNSEESYMNFETRMLSDSITELANNPSNDIPDSCQDITINCETLNNGQSNHNNKTVVDNHDSSKITIKNMVKTIVSNLKNVNTKLIAIGNKNVDNGQECNNRPLRNNDTLNQNSNTMYPAGSSELLNNKKSLFSIDKTDNIFKVNESNFTYPKLKNQLSKCSDDAFRNKHNGKNLLTPDKIPITEALSQNLNYDDPLVSNRDVETVTLIDEVPANSVLITNNENGNSEPLVSDIGAKYYGYENTQSNPSSIATENDIKEKDINLYGMAPNNTFTIHSHLLDEVMLKRVMAELDSVKRMMVMMTTTTKNKIKIESNQKFKTSESSENFSKNQPILETNKQNQIQLKPSNFIDQLKSEKDSIMEKNYGTDFEKSNSESDFETLIPLDYEEIKYKNKMFERNEDINIPEDNSEKTKLDLHRISSKDYTDSEIDKKNRNSNKYNVKYSKGEESTSYDMDTLMCSKNNPGGKKIEPSHSSSTYVQSKTTRSTTQDLDVIRTKYPSNSNDLGDLLHKATLAITVNSKNYNKKTRPMVKSTQASYKIAPAEVQGNEELNVLHFSDSKLHSSSTHRIDSSHAKKITGRTQFSKITPIFEISTSHSTTERKLNDFKEDDLEDSLHLEEKLDERDHLEITENENEADTEAEFLMALKEDSFKIPQKTYYKKMGEEEDENENPLKPKSGLQIEYEGKGRLRRIKPMPNTHILEDEDERYANQLDNTDVPKILTREQEDEDEKRVVLDVPKT